jgi:hypothetical protein
MESAFEAIRSFGPEARQAVPELTRLVSAPFTPIELGKDSYETIANKLYDIAVRSEAVDALACIGEAAAPATLPLIDWALAIRVVPTKVESRQERELFVDLVALDVEYKAVVLSAIREFGIPAMPAVAKLLKSSDAERRKLAVLILGSDALPIVTELLNSDDCSYQMLATTILADMGPLVAKPYLTQLRNMFICAAN